MKATKLIQKLEKLVDRHGDLDVLVDGDEIDGRYNIEDARYDTEDDIWEFIGLEAE